MAAIAGCGLAPAHSAMHAPAASAAVATTRRPLIVTSVASAPRPTGGCSPSRSATGQIVACSSSRPPTAGGTGTRYLPRAGGKRAGTLRSGSGPRQRDRTHRRPAVCRPLVRESPLSPVVVLPTHATGTARNGSVFTASRRWHAYRGSDLLIDHRGIAQVPPVLRRVSTDRAGGYDAYPRCRCWHLRIAVMSPATTSPPATMPSRRVIG